MYLVSTTSCWNVGDDLIREGVLRILGKGRGEAMIWLNRCQVIAPEHPYGWNPLWRLKRNQPDLRTIVSEASALILAGTPEWLQTLEEVYDQCAKHRIPIWAIGIGMLQPGFRRLRRCRRRGLISRASVRDDLATITLDRAGVEHRWFLDPAFHADYDPVPAAEKAFDVVLTYKRNPLTDLADKAYLSTYERFRDRIDLIAVHHADEYVYAKQLFGREIYFSSDYTDFKWLYANCRHLITNRIHSAAPALRNGADVHFFKNIRKHRMVEMWKEALERCCEPGKVPLHLYAFDEAETIRLTAVDQQDRMAALFESDLREHQEYARLIQKSA